LGQWLSLRLSTLLHENYIMFIVIGAAIDFGAGINLGLEIVKSEQKTGPGKGSSMAWTMTQNSPRCFKPFILIP
jgi:hypothetical protein